MRLTCLRHLAGLVLLSPLLSGGKRPLVHVDQAEKLTALGLLGHFPMEVWPATNAVRKLATKIKAVLRTGQEAAFVCADLRE